jgi:hypothetical protein
VDLHRISFGVGLLCGRLCLVRLGGFFGGGKSVEGVYDCSLIGLDVICGSFRQGCV